MYTNVLNNVMFYSPYFNIKRICKMTIEHNNKRQILTFEFEIDSPILDYQDFYGQMATGILWLFNNSTNFGMSPKIIYSITMTDNLHSIFGERNSYFITIQLPVFENDEALKFVLEGLR